MPKTRMTRSGLLPEATNVEDEELQSLVAGQAAKLEKLFEALRERLREVENDPGLNRQGRRERRREVAEEFAPAVEEALNLSEVKRMDSRVETLEETLFRDGPHVEVPAEEADRIHRQARETRELLRERFRETSNLEERQEIVDLIRDAVENNEKATLLALRDAPPAFPVLDSSDLPSLDDIRALHAETHFPDKVQEARERRSTVSTIHFNLNQAREEFRELTNGVDPVEEPRFHVIENGSLEPVEPFADEGESESESEGEPEGETDTADEPAGDAEPVAAE